MIQPVITWCLDVTEVHKYHGEIVTKTETWQYDSWDDLVVGLAKWHARSGSGDPIAFTVRAEMRPVTVLVGSTPWPALPQVTDPVEQLRAQLGMLADDRERAKGG